MDALLERSHVVPAVALAVAIAFVVAQSRSSSTRAAKRTQKIKTLPKCHPVLGDLVEQVQNRERMYDWLLEHSLNFDGQPWKIQVPGQAEMVIFTMPEAVQEITMAELDVFPKGTFQRVCLTDMFGAGLVASDGARWYHQRKAAAKFFSAKVLRTIMNESMQKHMEKVYATIDSKMRSLDGQVDLKQLFHEFTIDTFAELGMGVRLNSIGASEPHPFAEALDLMAPVTARRFCVPMSLWKTERWLNIGLEAVMNKQKKIVREWLRQCIQESLSQRTSKMERGETSDVKSIVDLFMEFNDEDSDGVQADDLVDFLLTFVIGARDTTANTLSWLFYALSKNPEVERTLRAEMKLKLEGDRISFLTPDHIKTLLYLEATIKETIRLYPAAPWLLREVGKDTVICGDIQLYAGQLASTSPYVMGRHPRVWGDDACEFKPERWIDAATQQIRYEPPTKFYGFSAGPRGCIGVSLAMLELRVVTANLLYRYAFEIDPSNDGSYEVSPTLNMKYPLYAKATSMSAAAA